LFVSSLCLSCAAPEEPESLQKTTTTRESQESAVVSRSTQTFNFGGAAVGDDDLRATVKSCVEKGLFYERSSTNSPGCTSYSLAKMDCTNEGVKASMSVGIRKAYEENLKSDDPLYGLAGFVVDQCLDCPTADANSVCASATTGNPNRRPGFLIMLLKQSGNQLLSRKQFIVKE
jgi:hypothetical protein